LTGRSVRVGEVPETVAGHLEGGRRRCRVRTGDAGQPPSRDT